MLGPNINQSRVQITGNNPNYTLSNRVSKPGLVMFLISNVSAAQNELFTVKNTKNGKTV